MNEIEDPCIVKAHEKSHLVVQAYNDNKNLVLTQSPTIQPAYNVNREFYIWLPCEQISLLGASSDRVVKFSIYHPHYKEKRGITESAYNPFLLQPPCKRIFLLGASSDCIVKFTADYPYYKEIPGMTESAHNPFLFRLPPKLTVRS